MATASNASSKWYNAARTHLLKVDQNDFPHIEEGRKLFEYRINDRDFQVGDWLVLAPWDGEEFHSWNCEVMEVTYILWDTAFGVAAGYCVMSVRPVEGLSDGHKSIIYESKKHERNRFLQLPNCPVCYGKMVPTSNSEQS